jgi:hypothetical protein
MSGSSSATIPGATPTAAADTTSGAGAAALATAPGAAGNPGGAAGYADVTSTAATTANGNVFANLTIPTASMPTALPPGLDGLSYPMITTTAAQAAIPIGTGKGAKRPDLTRLSDLVKFAAALDNSLKTGQLMLPNLNPGTVDDVLKQSGFSAKDREAFAATLAHPRGVQQDNPGIHLNEAVMSQVFPQLWSDIITHVKGMGIAIPQDDLAAPNVDNMLTKLQSLGALRLDQPTIDALERQGYDTKGLRTVASLITGHDAMQFARGAPGTTTAVPGVAASTTKTQESASSIWNQFVNNWNANPTTVTGQKYRDAMVTDLVAVGALDTTSGNAITVEQVQQAYATVFQQAAKDGISITQELEQTLPQSLPTGPGGVPLADMNLSQAYVMHVADQILGPNSITPFQAQALANVAQKEGTGTAAAADLIQQGVVSLYDPKNPQTQGASFAATAYQTATDVLSEWGIPANPQTLAPLVTNIVKQTLAAGVTAPYQITTLATAAAEEYAKTQAGSLYGEGVGKMANQGVSVSQQAQPYLATAADLLGVPVSQMSVADPSGKWMKWAEGGTGPGGTMTQAQWAQYLMQDPSYNFQQSKPAQNAYAQGANGLLSLFGKLPAAPNPFQGGGISLPTVGA